MVKISGLVSLLSDLLDPSFIIVFDENGTISEFSNNTLTGFGYTKEELYKIKFEHLIFWESSDTKYSEIQFIFNKDKQLQFEGLCIKNGEAVFPAKISVKYLLEEEKYISVITDLSTQKRELIKLKETVRSNEQMIQIQARQIDELMIQVEYKDDEVEQSQERLKIYTKLVSYINSVWDMDMLLMGYLDILSLMNITYTSSIYLYDGDSQNFILKAETGVKKDSLPPVLEQSNSIVSQIIQKKQSIILNTGDYFHSFKIQTTLGEWTPNSIIIFPVKNMDEILAIVTMAFGHSPKKKEIEFYEHIVSQLGLVIHNLNQYSKLKNLAETLHKQSIEIESKNEELEKTSLMKSVFLTNMSHELHTPLTAIMGFTEIIRDELFGKLNDKQKELIQDIYTAGSQLMRMMDTLLSISKMENGKISKDLNMFIFQRSMESEIHKIKEKAKLHEIKIYVDFPPTPIYINADELKIRTILLNLALNAVKFTPRKGEIYISAKTENSNLLLKVEDNGIGINERYHKDIFKPFHQVLPEKGNLPIGGAGLGLSLAQKFAELHNGYINVNSTPGKGSTFTVFLPKIVIDANVFETMNSDVD